MAKGLADSNYTKNSIVPYLRSTAVLFFVPHIQKTEKGEYKNG